MQYIAPRCKRAIQTITPLATKLDLPIEKDSRLTEVSFGDLSGKTQEDIADLIGEDMVATLNSYDYDLRPFNGESVADVQERVQEFLDDLKNQNHKMALVCAHGGIVRMVNYLCSGEKIGLPPNAKPYRFKL